MSRKEWTLGIAGTLILGALGSGLWDALLRPGFSWLGQFGLTVVTLGLTSAQNSVYREIAKGHHELPSLLLLALFICGTTVVPPFALLTSRFAERILGIQESNHDEVTAELRWRRARRVVIPIVSLLVGILLARTQMLIYANRAVTHFDQSLAICRPYLDGRGDNDMRAKFASVRTRRDMELLLERLDTLAKANNTVLPEFTLW